MIWPDSNNKSMGVSKEIEIIHRLFLVIASSMNFNESLSLPHCKVIIGRNPIEANANTVAIQLPGNPAAYIGKCFTPY